MIVMTIIAIVFTPLWIAIRPQFVIARDRFHIASEQVWGPDTFEGSPYANESTKFLGKLPRNEIAWTETNHKTVLVDQLPSPLEGLRIAHLSDIHLTGQLSHQFYHRAVEWVIEQEPDLVVVAGDIVDYDENLDDIHPVFHKLTAPLGCYFVLGNHDKRLTNPMEICDRLADIGWKDAGNASHVLSYKATEIEIIGNELPWFDRYDRDPSDPKPGVWRMGIAHSPDQFLWGIRNRCSLLLCGHTHGGQIRFPFLGPLVSPSLHGSKYASGVFYQRGTVMHVSRGMAGVHPLRWGCPPEVSILHLANHR